MTRPSVVVSVRPDRPLGIWLLTLYALVFAGLAPFLAALGLLGVARSDLGVDALSLIYSALSSFFIMVVSVMTWRGNRVAMVLLVALVILHYLLVICWWG